MMNDFGQFSEDAYELFLEMATEEYAQVDKDKMPCNKPRRLNDGSGKSHVVKACYPGAPEGGKLIKFGQKGASTAGDPKKGESERMKAKRKSFKARHGKNIAKGPKSAAYWANKVKW
jgi:hypothetical protein